ncbi:MAG: putative glycoside hydrolase [Clostridia bacterium]|nr:putative glycoside hydrolase [Clostridia bacterium]
MRNKTLNILAVTLLSLSLTMSACSNKDVVPTETQVVDSLTEGAIEHAALGQYDPEKVRFISQDSILYSESSSTSEVQGDILRFTEVELVEEKAENEEAWSKVNYVILDQYIEGWLPSGQLTSNLGETFRKGFTHLDFDPKYKVESYKNNPKIEARALYLTVNSTRQRIDEFIQIANETDINAFVIDVKADRGNMLFNSDAAEKYCPDANTTYEKEKVREMLQKLKDNNIYAIARIVTFKDTIYAQTYPERATVYKSSGKIYQSRDKLYWGTPHDRQFWEYNLAVSMEAADMGFNEIQFDYVRFPDVSAATCNKLDYRNEKDETKAEAIQKFLEYSYEELSKKEVYVGADIFGQVGSVVDDMGIGQYWEAVSNSIDFICPMMYPSHYGPNVYGLSVPDQFPYETVYYCTKDGIERNQNISTPAVIRPWIQDFTATWVTGYIPYRTREVKAQIQALKDLGVEQYMIWNAGNNYHTDALK